MDASRPTVYTVAFPKGHHATYFVVSSRRVLAPGWSLMTMFGFRPIFSGNTIMS
jgi:hypothetical protein